MATTESQSVTDLRALDHTQMSRWKKVFIAYLNTKNCSDGLKEKPKLKARVYKMLLGEGGTPTAGSKAYKELFRKRLVSWQKKDRKAYGYLVKACESNESAMEVILDEDNADLPAKDLLEALETRFYQGDIVGVVQAKLAAFHTLAIDSKETVERFINRILAARRELVELGCDYVSKDVHCLGRLKEALLLDERFKATALTLQVNPQMTWDEGVRVLTALDASSTKREANVPVAAAAVATT